jgi:hypothetical protein
MWLMPLWGPAFSISSSSYFPANKGRSLHNSSPSKSFEHYLNGHILGTYCLEFISSIPIISILPVIQFILLRPDVSIFVAINRQTFQDFRHGSTLWINAFSQKYICNLIIKQRAHTKNMEKKLISVPDIQL